MTIYPSATPWMLWRPSVSYKGLELRSTPNEWE